MDRLDPGLQPQRTALAWNRTCLALTANGLLLLRAGLQQQSPLILVLGAGVLVLCLMVWLLAQQRHRILLLHPDTSRVAARAQPALLCLALACGCAVIGGTLAILPIDASLWWRP